MDGGKETRGKYREMETEEERQRRGIEERPSERKRGEIEGRDRWRDKELL